MKTRKLKHTRGGMFTALTKRFGPKGKSNLSNGPTLKPTTLDESKLKIFNELVCESINQYVIENSGREDFVYPVFIKLVSEYKNQQIVNGIDVAILLIEGDDNKMNEDLKFLLNIIRNSEWYNKSLLQKSLDKYNTTALQQSINSKSPFGVGIKMGGALGETLINFNFNGSPIDTYTFFNKLNSFVVNKQQKRLVLIHNLLNTEDYDVSTQLRKLLRILFFDVSLTENDYRTSLKYLKSLIGDSTYYELLFQEFWKKGSKARKYKYPIHNDNIKQHNMKCLKFILLKPYEKVNRTFIKQEELFAKAELEEIIDFSELPIAIASYVQVATPIFSEETF